MCLTGGVQGQDSGEADGDDEGRSAFASGGASEGSWACSMITRITVTSEFTDVTRCWRKLVKALDTYSPQLLV
uniref:Uncharacterized protein n=1 Tax=Physcomitrium patens TaxID=3218 RepID=A0A2K1IJS9_PHYPA|nr:hypothetical protein PHYPA_028227 [Physcomitrium patens]